MTDYGRGWLLAGLLALTLALGGCATRDSADAGDNMAAAEAAWQAEDYPRALVLLRQEAVRGNATAQYALGYMYYWGQGVEPDLEQALVWIQRAAENGSDEAVEALGTLAGSITNQERARRGLSTESPLPPPEPAPPGEAR
jgi:TPR repeat protein